jgi:type II secretory pathway pseudopilin PulG
LVAAMLVLMIVASLSAVTFQVAVHSSSRTGYDNKQNLAVWAAQTGVSTYLASLIGDGKTLFDPSTKVCAGVSTTTPTQLTKNPNSSYLLTVTWSTKAGATGTCPGSAPLASDTMSKLVVAAVGYAGYRSGTALSSTGVCGAPTSSNVQTACRGWQVSVALSQVTAFSNASAIYGGTNVIFNSSGGVYTFSAADGCTQHPCTNNAVIYSPGGVSFLKNSVLEGSVEAQGCTIATCNFSTGYIDGNIWVKGDIQFSGAQVVGQGLDPVNQQESYSCNAAGVVSAGAPINGPNTLYALNSQPAWPCFGNVVATGQVLGVDKAYVYGTCYAGVAAPAGTGVPYSGSFNHCSKQVKPGTTNSTSATCGVGGSHDWAGNPFSSTTEPCGFVKPVSTTPGSCSIPITTTVCPPPLQSFPQVPYDSTDLTSYSNPAYNYGLPTYSGAAGCTQAETDINTWATGGSPATAGWNNAASGANNAVLVQMPAGTQCALTFPKNSNWTLRGNLLIYNFGSFNDQGVNWTSKANACSGNSTIYPVNQCVLGEIVPYNLTVNGAPNLTTLPNPDTNKVNPGACLSSGTEPVSQALAPGSYGVAFSNLTTIGNVDLQVYTQCDVTFNNNNTVTGQITGGWVVENNKSALTFVPFSNPTQVPFITGYLSAPSYMRECTVKSNGTGCQ